MISALSKHSLGCIPKLAPVRFCHNSSAGRDFLEGLYFEALTEMNPFNMLPKMSVVSGAAEKKIEKSVVVVKESKTTENMFRLQSQIKDLYLTIIPGPKAFVERGSSDLMVVPMQTAVIKNQGVVSTPAKFFAVNSTSEWNPEIATLYRMMISGSTALAVRGSSDLASLAEKVSEMVVYSRGELAILDDEKALEAMPRVSFENEEKSGLNYNPWLAALVAGIFYKYKSEEKK